MNSRFTEVKKPIEYTPQPTEKKEKVLFTNLSPEEFLSLASIGQISVNLDTQISKTTEFSTDYYTVYHNEGQSKKRVILRLPIAKNENLYVTKTPPYPNDPRRGILVKMPKGKNYYTEVPIGCGYSDGLSLLSKQVSEVESIIAGMVDQHYKRLEINHAGVTPKISRPVSIYKNKHYLSIVYKANENGPFSKINKYIQNQVPIPLGPVEEDGTRYAKPDELPTFLTSGMKFVGYMYLNLGATVYGQYHKMKETFDKPQAYYEKFGYNVSFTLGTALVYKPKITKNFVDDVDKAVYGEGVLDLGIEDIDDETEAKKETGTVIDIGYDPTQ